VEAQARRLRRWQGVTLGLLVVGYSGYYLCRSNLSVALPLIVDELAAGGMGPEAARIRLGGIVSLGVVAYAIGKFLSGALGDFLGGRRNFLAGMAGSVAFTLLFAAGGALPLFTLAWIGNRLVQSMGWVGMVKIASRWFPYSAYGSVMALVSLSFLFGDAAARGFMGLLIAQGLAWRGVFVVAACALAGLFVASLVLLHESPRRIGLAEPPTSPGNLFGAGGDDPRPPGLRALLAPILRSRAFWWVCALSLGLTLIRETFNTWTPTYFVEAVGLASGAAASTSALFPFMGGVAVLLFGVASDRFGAVGRAALILAGLATATLVLLGLALVDAAALPRTTVALVALAGFTLIGPYSYLAGAIALDFGGKQGSATTSGIVDGVGYIGGALAGDAMARISVAFGWPAAFGTLAGVALLSAVAAAAFLAESRRLAAAPVAAGRAA
jgi:OPA family glycerol-3-phosphate transporter-like MFS transporter